MDDHDDYGDAAHEWWAELNDYGDAGNEWWAEELGRVGDVVLDSVEAVARARALWSRQEARGPGTDAMLTEMRRLTALAEACLADAGGTYPLESGAYYPLEGISRTGLEVAEALASTVWKLLSAAIRRTNSLRTRIGLALVARRVASLRIRIAGRKAATLRTPRARALTPAAAAFQSLTRAAHGPPLPGSYRLPATTGGGPL